jgi:hypothetical protein
MENILVFTITDGKKAYWSYNFDNIATW